MSGGKRRITVLHTIETGGPGGAETLVLELASLLDPERFRSVAVVPPACWIQSQLADRGIVTVPLRSRRWYDPRPLIDILGVVRSQHVDLVHSHLPSQNFYGSLAARFSGKPAITTYHGPIELQQSTGLKGRIRLGAVRRAASIYSVVCDQMGDALRNAGFSRDKIVRVYNGVDVQRHHAEVSGTLRQLLGVDERTPIVGMVANIRSPKGYDNFIRAAQLVSARMPDARFVSIGDPHPVLSAQLDALVQELGLQQRFTFLGFRADAQQLLKDFNVFVLSSSSEGFPFAAIEAMAAAKASVMTRCGGPEEIVEEGVTGYLVPVGDAAALAVRIFELASSPDLADRMGRAARAKVLREFTLDGMINSYEALYEKLCA